MKKYIYIFTLCIFLQPAFVAAQPGSLDSSFNGDGFVKTEFNSNSSWTYAVAIQPDGKIVVAGTVIVWPGTHNFALTRYTKKGVLDKTFGTKGQVITAFNNLETVATSIIIQTNGMIIAGGYSNAGSVMARYTTDGKLDSTFGLNGKIISDFGIGTEGTYSLALQTDGKIIAAGVDSAQFALARYKQNGTRDSTFATNGLVTTNIGHNTHGMNHAVALQEDGKIIVSGFISDKNGVQDGILIRYKKNGHLDKNFANGGIAITDLGFTSDTYTSLIIQPNGKINAAGYTGDRHYFDFILTQYNENGTLDSNFNTNGITKTDFANVNDLANSLVLQRDGKIVVAGFTQSVYAPHYIKFALCRYKQNGNLDTSFGSNGKVITDFGGDAPDLAFAVTTQPDDKILAAGQTGQFQYFTLLARYNFDSSNLHFAKGNISTITQQQTNKSTTISLSPNPARDIVYLRGMSSNKKTIEVVSENGSAVLQNISTVNSKYSINTTHLLPGVYFVRITEGGQTTTLKFVKQ